MVAALFERFADLDDIGRFGRISSYMGMPSNFVIPHLCVLAAAVFFLSSPPVFGQPFRCPDPAFSVDANDDATALQLCALASDIHGKLETCGLRQSRILTIEIADELSHPLGNCIAYFDCEYDLLRITDPSNWERLLEQDQAYHGLPEDVILRALLTHEIAHALVTQTAGEHSVPMVDQEYIAASMEL